MNSETAFLLFTKKTKNVNPMLTALLPNKPLLAFFDFQKF